MDGLGGGEAMYQGPGAARQHRYRRRLGQGANPAGITMGVGQGHVARHGGDAHQVKLLARGQGQQQGNGIVYTRVTINY
jgi:hypothetical protein